MTTQAARDKAEALRVQLGLETIPVPVERIAKRLGADVRFTHFDGDLSSLIYREDESTIIIGVNSAYSPARRRLALAHQLGHLVLGHLDAKGFGELHIDRGFPLKGNRHDTAATAFAVALLIPQKEVRADVATGGEMDYEDGELARSLAERYKVSSQAMLLRLLSLGAVEA